MTGFSCPYGVPRRRLKEDAYKVSYANASFNQFRIAERVLAFLAYKMGVEGRMRTNLNFKEFKSKLCKRGYRTDGEFLQTCPITKQKQRIGIEIHGCAFHAHPDCSQLDQKWVDIQHCEHPVVKDHTYLQLFERDNKRLKDLLQHEFHTIHVFRLCQFEREFLLEGISPRWKEWKDWCENIRPDLNVDANERGWTETEILNEIVAGRIRGFLICDVVVEGEARERTENFPIIFRHATVKRSDLDSWMRERLESRGAMKRPVRQLVSVHRGKQITVSTNLVQFYHRMGAKIRNITKIFQYLFTDALTDFVNTASQLRFASKTIDEKIISGLQKSLVVSTYGKCCQNPLLFKKTVIAGEKELMKHIYAKNLHNIEYLGDGEGEGGGGIYEVNLKPKKITFNSYLPLSCTILDNAKLRILSLVYDVLQPFFRDDTYDFFTTQTDSLSLMTCAKDFEDFIESCIKEDKKAEFEAIRPLYFPPKKVETEEDRFAPFKPGIYKVEWSGSHAIALSSKSYMVVDETKEKVRKLALRGLPKKSAKKIKFETFENTLHSGESIFADVSNMSFIGNKMRYLITRREAIAGFVYSKRKIRDPKYFSTQTLDLSDSDSDLN